MTNDERIAGFRDMVAKLRTDADWVRSNDLSIVGGTDVEPGQDMAGMVAAIERSIGAYESLIAWLMGRGDA